MAFCRLTSSPCINAKSCKSWMPSPSSSRSWSNSASRSRICWSCTCWDPVIAVPVVPGVHAFVFVPSLFDKSAASNAASVPKFNCTLCSVAPPRPNPANCASFTFSISWFNCITSACWTSNSSSVNLDFFFRASFLYNSFNSLHSSDACRINSLISACAAIASLGLFRFDAFCSSTNPCTLLSRSTIADLSSKKRDPVFFPFLPLPMVTWPACAARFFFSSSDDFSLAPTCSWIV
mmetsp:Transcript_1519/g.2295  ORF Transcript_1519/g.2295 Transcript_1519/m.2295 type:complete len:235 (-) Transcript_1519:127-831(-)